ncbi:putative Xre family DNA-binding protein [Gordonia effusa NBRC 100432]|uniref:Putative Xre family DNA-binding protein n=1 Tax=Gordonia effusa NBRC 100432 TaxID=1077974 RepID=H0QZQ9_9ACTN|nr:helix-turn-helix transcriptional regulator [Gordonia effusa]GAB18310.1 putative Xre family DNA-binding protein [Gordonia effusa NBRC 100432]
MPAGKLDDYAPDRVKLIRERSGVSLREIAARCGVTVGTVRSWEAGRLTPSETNGVKLASALRVHVAEFTNTPRNQPTLRQMRQWLGWSGAVAADKAGIGVTPVYTAESYTSPIPERIQIALADAYGVNSDAIVAAWKRGQQRAFGDISQS